VEDRTKYKHIHKNKHDHINNQMWNMFVTVGPLYETGEKMEIDSESIISHNKR
jgi:hypothetical protein